ncbi:MAG: T9SS type A sorting domain-containing protein [Bacteroidota bacterium]
MANTPLVDPSEGLIPQHMTWEVYNTLLAGPSFNIAGAIPAEVQQTQWGYYCTDNTILNSSTFVQYKITNRSNDQIEDFRAGIWTDFDLGCSLDDFLGCDPDRNTYFVYNRNNTDGDACNGFGEIFGENPPVQAVTFLNQDITSFLAQFSEGGVIPQELLGPFTNESIFNLLSGRFNDGTQITDVELGTSENEGEETPFHFYGDPNNADEWSLMSVEAEDFRAMPGLGSVTFGSWGPGETVVLDMVNSYHREPGNNHLENVTAMYDGVDQLQALYDNDEISASCTPLVCIDECVWPGDLNNDGIANHVDLIALGFGLNETGPTRGLPINWSGLPAETWGSNQVFIDQPDLKHLDANDDGMVDREDFRQTRNFYDFTRPDYDPSLDETFLEGLDVRFTRSNGSDFNDISSAIVVDAHVSLFSPFDDLVGIALEMEYDNNLFDRFDPNEFPFNNESIGRFDRDVTDSTIQISAYFFDEELSQDEPFRINALRFFVDNQYLESVDSVSVRFKNIRGWLADGTEVALGARTSWFRPAPSSANEPEWEEEIIIFPNPATNILNLSSGLVKIDNLEIYDNLGQLIIQHKRPSTQIDISSIHSGLHYLKIEAEGKIIFKKIIVSE